WRRVAYACQPAAPRTIKRTTPNSIARYSHTLRLVKATEVGSPLGTGAIACCHSSSFSLFFHSRVTSGLLRCAAISLPCVGTIDWFNYTSSITMTAHRVLCASIRWIVQSRACHDRDRGARG